MNMTRLWTLRHRRAAALGEREHLIGSDAWPALFEAVRPPHVDSIDACIRAEPEVHTQVVLRDVAAAAADLLHLHDRSRTQRHARADRASVRPGADKPEEQPVVGRGS